MATPTKWGGEIPVNTTTQSTQDQPKIEALANGRFVAARVRRWLDERRARRELVILSDVMLKDLAMDRSEIASVVRHGQSDRTRRGTRW